MTTRKVTFTFDERTVRRLDQTAAQLNKSKSLVVREAVQEYANRVGRLSEQERRAMLRVFDEFVPSIPERPAAEVDAEIQEIRDARHRGGRRSAGAGQPAAAEPAADAEP